MANITLSFDSLEAITETVYTVRIDPGQFNRSYNPTLVSNTSTGELKSFAQADSFRPHFTTVALCNDQGDILMIAKVTHPVPVPLDTPLNVQIRLVWPATSNQSVESSVPVSSSLPIAILAYFTEPTDTTFPYTLPLTLIS